jgi:hypothetical protein
MKTLIDRNRTAIITMSALCVAIWAILLKIGGIL